MSRECAYAAGMKNLALIGTALLALSGCAMPPPVDQQEIAATAAAQEAAQAAEASWRSFVASDPAGAEAVLKVAKHNRAIEICAWHVEELDAMYGQALDTSPCGSPEVMPADAPTPPSEYIGGARLRAFASDWDTAVQRAATALGQSRIQYLRENPTAPGGLACQWEPALPFDFEAQALSNRGCTPNNITVAP